MVQIGDGDTTKPDYYYYNLSCSPSVLDPDLNLFSIILSKPINKYHHMHIFVIIVLTQNNLIALKNRRAQMLIIIMIVILL